MEFRIRTYDKRELAQMYFPGTDRDTAMRHLRRWIVRCPDLRRRLAASNSKIFTPQQVSLIVEYLGVP